MQPPVVRPGPRRRDGIAAAAIAGLTFVVFLRALDCGFINFDDPYYVTRNKLVTNGLTVEGARWAFTAVAPYYWHPLTWLSLQLDASLWWPKPAGFLLTNVLLHAANAALLFLALRSLTGAYWRSVAVALLFALHPLRVESVAWVAERKDVLSVCLGLLALCAYAAYGSRPSALRYLAVAAAYALSLMAKPMLVTLPCLLLVLDWWPLGRLPLSRRTGRATGLVVLEKLPLLALAAASCVVTARAHAEAEVWGDPGRLSVAGRVENATVSYVIYLSKTVWPADLAIYYPHPLLAYNKADHLPAGEVAAAALLLAAATVGAIALRKRAPYLLAGWVWYLVALLPVIGLVVQSGGQAYADRFAYFPQIGILVAACWAVADLAGKRARVALTAGAVLAAVLAVTSWNQLSYWHDPQTVWKHDLETAGSNPVALINLGEYLGDDEAARCFQKAIEMDPDSAIAHLNLGNIFIRAGRLDDATREEEAAVRINPKLDGAYGNLGNIELKRRRYDRAAEYFRQQLSLQDSADARSNLGAALNYQGKLADAESEFNEALRLDPALTSAHANLGGVLHRQGRLDEAALEEQKAIELAPRLYEAHYQLAMIETDRANYARAVECFRTALRLRPGSIDALSGLGAALIQQGRADEALAVMTEVVRGRPQDGSARFNLGKALEGHGDLEGAASQYDAATRLSPELAQAWYDLGRVRARQGRQGEAIASFEQAISRDASSQLYREALEAARRPQDHSGAGKDASAPR
jgi:tetratricopeptide (TPR) repeat protein